MNMNNIVKIVWCLAFLYITAAISGCSKEERLIFDKPGHERVLDQLEKCEQTLLAHTNGWQMVYRVPKDELEAAFTVQFQFGENKSVKIWTDYLNEPETSSYRLSLYSGPVLTFDTPGALTVLANPAIRPRPSDKPGKGYYGENDFIIMSVSPDSIVLRGLKYGKPGKDLVLLPLAEPAGVTNSGVSAEFRSGVRNLTQFGTARSLYYKETELTVVRFEIPPMPALISSTHKLPTITMVQHDLKNNKEVARHDVKVSSKGMTLNPGVKVKDKEYTDFVFDVKKRRMTAKDNADVYINMQTMTELTFKLTQGAYVRFSAKKFSSKMKKYVSKEIMDKTFPGYGSIQWYNYSDLYSLTVYHKQDGKGMWDNIVVQLSVVDDKGGIYALVPVGKSSNDVLDTEAMRNAVINNTPENNGARVLAVYFTLLGGDDKTIKIEDINPSDQRIRMTSTFDPDLWIEFKVF